MNVFHPLLQSSEEFGGFSQIWFDIFHIPSLLCSWNIPYSRVWNNTSLFFSFYEKCCIFLWNNEISLNVLWNYEIKANSIWMLSLSKTTSFFCFTKRYFVYGYFFLDLWNKNIAKTDFKNKITWTKLPFHNPHWSFHGFETKSSDIIWGKKNPMSLFVQAKTTKLPPAMTTASPNGRSKIWFVAVMFWLKISKWTTFVPFLFFIFSKGKFRLVGH